MKKRKSSAAMAKHLMIDGFNVIRRNNELSQIERRNFTGAQEVLAQRMAQYRRGTAHQITVVYDGRNGQNPYRQRLNKSGVEVIYSARGETADEVILDLVSRLGGERSGCVVVTADRDLGLACKRQGAAVLPPEELMRQTQARQQVRLDPEYFHGKHEEQGWSGSTAKHGNPRRPAKPKRQPHSLW